MMPYLFPSDATIFSGGGYGALTKCISCQIRQELGSTGVYELNMEILTDDPLFMNMSIGKIIAARPNLTDETQAFVIEQMTNPIDNIVSVYATHIAQHRTKLIPIDVINESNLDDAIRSILHYSMEFNPFNLHTSRVVSIPFRTDTPKSMRSILGGEEGSLLDIYGGEYIFDNFDIELVNKRGRYNEIQVVYGRNMTNFEIDEEFSFETSVTGIVPYWYSEDEGLVVGSVQYSDYVDQFRYHKTITKDYTEEFKEKPTAAQLNIKAAADVKELGFPNVNTKIAFNEFDRLKGNISVMQLGDTVKVINSNYGVNTTARICSMTFNVLADRYDEIQIGQLEPSINEVIKKI